MTQNFDKIENNLKIVDQCNSKIRELDLELAIAKNIKDSSREELLYQAIDAEQMKRQKAVRELNIAFKFFDLGVRTYPYPQLPKGTRKRYIAFLDLLGFSSIIDGNDSSEIDLLIEKLIGEIQLSIAYNPERYITGNLDGGFSPDLNKARVNSIVFSDTIIFWSNDDSVDSFKSVVEAVSMFFNNAVIGRSWAVRGAITFGDLSYTSYDIANKKFLINQSGLYGKSIIDGYDLEGKQEWIGCMVSESAIEHFLQSENEDGKKYLNKKLLKYDVPLKKNAVLKQQYVIWWGWGQDSEKNVERFFIKHARLDRVPECLQVKYENTCKYLNYSREVSKARTQS
ncbi:hypothetical protein Dfri01_58550 [Dyadobacter frigoris]|uniref:hypothetical protein n=1 Tax=Dyadobacter frigoris TaxID=2576211 RepID=UPI0024A52A6A|nr:hypothetical protein [Dyadobacter frigoris]GLU56394.1 hypothetical protein Dfri01_58550 [Dyadobacter frigoris]